MRFFSVLRHPHTALGLRIVVGGFFLVAAIAKLTQPTALFANQIKSFGIVPEAWSFVLAQILPWVELFSGWFLIAGFFAGWAAFFVGAQLAVFSVVLAVSIVFGTAPADCGCLPGVSETPAQALARDLIMMTWLGISFHGLPGSFSMDGWLGRS